MLQCFPLRVGATVAYASSIATAVPPEKLLYIAIKPAPARCGPIAEASVPGAAHRGLRGRLPGQFSRRAKLAALQGAVPCGNPPPRLLGGRASAPPANVDRDAGTRQQSARP